MRTYTRTLRHSSLYKTSYIPDNNEKLDTDFDFKYCSTNNQTMKIVISNITRDIVNRPKHITYFEIMHDAHRYENLLFMTNNFILHI